MEVRKTPLIDSAVAGFRLLPLVVLDSLHKRVEFISRRAP